MNKLLLFFTLFSFYNSIAQNTFELDIDRLENTRNRVAFTAIEIDDGFFLTSWVEALEITDSGNYATDDVMLIKIDKEGNILWDKKYTTLTTHEITNNIFETKNKNEFIFCHDEYSQDTLSIVLNKIDANGNVLWKHTLAGFRYMRSFLELKNSDLLFACSLSAGGNKILKYTKDGTLINEFRVQKNNTSYVLNMQIIDGYLYVYGIGGNNNSGSFIDKYDMDYNLIYSLEIDADLTKANGIKSIFHKNEKYYFITRGEELYSFDINTGEYSKLNDDFYDKRRRIDQFIYTSDNNYLLSYHWTNFETVNKYDEEFNLIWRKEYYKGERLIFKDLIETEDGGLLFFGWYNPMPDENSPYLNPGQLYILKTDCEGNKEWSSDACYVPQIINLTIFPNPFQDVLKIQIPNLTETDNYNIELYNKLGQFIINEQIRNKITAINTITFSDGIYFYKITNNNKIIEQGKVLKN